MTVKELLEELKHARPDCPVYLHVGADMYDVQSASVNAQEDEAVACVILRPAEEHFE